MIKIGLIGCCKEKLTVPARARDLYISPLFRLARGYVVEHCDAWAILSAEHLLVMPDQILEPYDTTLVGQPAWKRKIWANMTRAAIKDHWKFEAEFVVVAGRLYLPAVRDLNYSVPFEGLGIGQLLQVLRWHEDQRYKGLEKRRGKRKHPGPAPGDPADVFNPPQPGGPTPSVDRAESNDRTEASERGRA